MDGSVEIVLDYTRWIDARYRGARFVSTSPMSDTHEEILSMLNERRYTFDEIAILFAGVMRSYCVDSADASGAARLFADEIHRMIGDEDYDDDGEMVDRTDAGGE